MRDALEQLWYNAKDLKHDANSATNNQTIHGLINDLIDEIEVAMSEDSYDEDEDVRAVNFDE